eukprot:scaffold57770_cov63-Attheya_sp.AAC.8
MEENVDKYQHTDWWDSQLYMIETNQDDPVAHYIVLLKYRSQITNSINTVRKWDDRRLCLINIVEEVCNDIRLQDMIKTDITEIREIAAFYEGKAKVETIKSFWRLYPECFLSGDTSILDIPE